MFFNEKISLTKDKIQLILSREISNKEFNNYNKKEAGNKGLSKLSTEASIATKAK